MGRHFGKSPIPLAIDVQDTFEASCVDTEGRSVDPNRGVGKLKVIFEYFILMDSWMDLEKKVDWVNQRCRHGVR